MVYQLAKTSVGLSGQLKWDIILNGSTVSDLQIVPIHESVPFNYTQREDTLNYSHLENITRLYKKIPSYFFEPVARPELLTGYPIRNTGTWRDTREEAYEMRMYRMTYQRYNKQFAFFCPLWVDEDIFDKNGELKLAFYLVIENNKGERLARKRLDLSLIEGYLKDYVKATNLNSDVCYLSFEEKQAWTKGINVESGDVVVKDTSYIIDNLLDQERPILETDSSILNQYAQNKLISTQLLNLNFIYDVTDIIPLSLVHHIVGMKLNSYIDIRWKNGDKWEDVPVKDIYSNYEHISKYDILEGKYSGVNCLNYLKDNRCIDLLGKNKIVQSVFHWALYDNPDYMFNLYDGCAPTYKDKDCKGLYFDTPDVFADAYSPYTNPLGWCKHYSIQYTGEKGSFSNDLDAFINNLQNNVNTMCSRAPIEKNGKWWFENIQIEEFDGMLDGMLNMAIIHILPKVNKDKTESQFPYDFIASCSGMFSNGDWRSFVLGKNYVVALYSISTHILLFFVFESYKEQVDLTEGCSLISLYNIRNNELSYTLTSQIDYYERKEDDTPEEYNQICLDLYGITDNENDMRHNVAELLEKNFTYLSTMFNHIVNPQVISYRKSVLPIEYERPNNLNKDFGNHEIYYVSQSKLSYVCRYDGKLQPMFIELPTTRKHNQNINLTYAIKQYNKQLDNPNVSSGDINMFNAYTWTGYKPIYPSLGYISFKRYYSIPYIYYRNSKRYYRDKSWYKKNEMYVLPDNYHIQYINTVKQGHLTEEKIKKLLRKKLVNKVDFHVYGNWNAKWDALFEDYFWNLYDYSYTYDYINTKNIKKFKYDITFTLK